ncbi:MAG TPA: polyribonucleotide nucleotidyltransferase, partial [Campylobacterales bacterium]|nr:polyribonucleotide nucleotidyltransferase [Campylobacterales bacterium]
MSSVVEIKFGNKTEIYELDKVARQAAGAVLLREKDAVILATVSRDDKMVDEDFLPLTVNYIEKNYAGAKFPAGFIKRETKPSDFETLTSRIIDRSLRPLFKKGYAYPTHIVIFVLSSDKEVDLQVMALNAASAALYVSDIPVEKNVCGVRIGKKDGEFIINPTNSELADSELDLYIAGTQDELLMIEMRALASCDSMNELSNEETIQAFDIASAFIKDATTKVQEKLSPYKKELANLELKDELDSKELLDFISSNYESDVKDAVSAMAKSERASELNVIAKNISQTSQAIENFWSLPLIEKVLADYKKGIVRDMIINDRVRADGRGLKDVRDISIETNILPSAHSSCLFTRGQTQALVTVTLGGPKDSQIYERITSKENMYENFMVHYSFPGFSVGEASPLRPPGRRELGHSNLAKRALAPSFAIDSSSTVRIASDILESNGSSSMATICGGSLALKAADLDVKKLVAGVAMGLIIEGDKYAVLTDITGLEDHDGDMDFKIAGTI